MNIERNVTEQLQQLFFSLFDRSEVIAELTDVMDVCESMLRVQCTEWPILACPDVISLLTLAATLQDHIDSKVSVCESMLRVQCTEWPILACPDVISLLTLAATLQDHIDSKVSPDCC